MVHTFKISTIDGFEIEVIAENIPQALQTVNEIHPVHPHICTDPPTPTFHTKRISSIVTLSSCLFVARGLGGHGISDAREDV